MLHSCACMGCSGFGPVEKFKELPEEMFCARCGGQILENDEFEIEEDDYLYFYHTRKDCDE